MPKPSQIFNWFTQNITDDPDDVKQSRWSIAQQKKAYQYGRKRLLDSFRRLEKAGFETSDYMEDNRDILKPLSSITTEGELSEMLAQLVRAYNSPARSISWQRQHRENVIAGLQGKGYDFVNEENVADFGRYMRWARENEFFRGYDSSQVADLYDIYGNFWESEDFKKNAKDYIEDVSRKDRLEKMEPRGGWRSAREIHEAAARLDRVGKRGSKTSGGRNRSRGNRQRKTR